jgi:uncharacterized membrane protein
MVVKSMFLKINNIKNGFITIPQWIRILIVLCLIFGIILRFCNLENKLYSNDETFSSTYIYGRNLASIIETQIVNTSELQQYQTYNPNESLLESFSRILAHPYTFPPLYACIDQIFARMASVFTGDTAVINRMASVIISLFSLPLMYWLCWELFASPFISWLGMSIIAVSPIHLQYAQIVRSYSLTTVAILFSTASLLLAKRTDQRTHWILYATTVSMGLYSNLLFGFTIISHALYMMVNARAKVTKSIQHYIYASTFGISVFLPWFYLFISKPGLVEYAVEQVQNTHLNVLSFLEIWIKSIPRIFVDFVDPWVLYTNIFAVPQKLALPVVMVVVLVSVGLLIIDRSRSKNWLILSLILGGGVLLMVKDIILGGTYSTRLRYMLTYVIGLELAVMALIYFLDNTQVVWHKYVNQILVICLLTLGILSCTVIVLAPSWWAFGAPDYPLMAQALNKLSKPVVLYNDFGDALTMSYLTQNHVYFHLTRQAKFYLKEDFSFYHDYSHIILFKPSTNLLHELKQNHLILDPVFQSKGAYPDRPNLWIVSTVDSE